MNTNFYRKPEPSFSLTAWREKLVMNCLRGACILALPALVLSGYTMIQNGLYLQLGINISFVAILLIVTLCPVSFTIRIRTSLFLLYCLSMNLLFETGVHGGARLLFFMFVLIALLIVGLRAALFAFALVLASIGIFAWLLFTHVISLTNPTALNYPIESWISDIMIFITLLCTALVGIATLLREFALAREKVGDTLASLEKEQSQLEQCVVERTHELEVLYETSLEISGQLELRDLLRNIVERGCSLLGVSTGGIYIFDEKSEYLELIFATGLSRDYTGQRMTPDEGLAGKVFSSGEPLVLDNYSAWNGHSASWETESLSGVLAVPLRYGARMLGVIDFADIGKPKRFNDNDVWLASLFAHQASIAINNARLYEKAQYEITERIHAEDALQKSQDQLRHDALHDALTGLPNRDLLLDRLGHAIARGKRRNEFVFAVIFIDIDRFKVINDSLGHVVGDRLLIAVARRLETCLRAVDMVARLGGDEFVIYLEDIKEPGDAADVADRILRDLKQHFIIDEHHVHITVSMGIVLSVLGYELPEDMVRDADIALYRAKGLGKAKYEIFDTSLRGQVIARLEIENDLHKALENRELFLNYQPIVDMETGRPIGVEALARWQHPGRGLVQPVEFIPVAEETGLIIPLGRWVLLEACKQMRGWQIEYPLAPQLRISVNLSPRQFVQPDLAEQLTKIIEESDLNPHYLRLEITEGILVQNIDLTLVILKKLHDLGVGIELDDFGTDYSSLHYLQQIPVDTIKIDRAFVSKMKVENKNAGIVRAIVSLAHELGMDTVAEGIETEEQSEYLKSLKCKFGQGYFFSRPMDSLAMKTYLEKYIQK